MDQTLLRVNAAIEDYQNANCPIVHQPIFEKEDNHRTHLGASLIGRDCSRQLWYVFRWAKDITHDARILRLFARGHLEEERFVFFLRQAGITIWQYDTNGRQFRMAACGGHYGGSMDGVGKGFPEKPDTPFLTEFKTHNDKSFALLEAKGVKESKPEHNIQMQQYMGAYGLTHAAYFAVNKNTDAWHAEMVDFNEAEYKLYLARAEHIIFSPFPPPREYGMRSHFKCKWCDYNSLCWTLEGAAVNCRTCAYSKPIEDGAWKCEHVDRVLAPSLIVKGCTNHTFIEGLVK
ncbi:MAG: hypothetical protein AB7C95_00735 [Synergistaceae bacterium]